MQRRAERFIDNFEWQELQNPYKNLQVSTLGADYRREEAARMAATSAQALRTAGVRGLIGGLGRVTANNNAINREVAANLDEQQKRIDFAGAGQDIRNQEMVERRQANELAGYGQMMNTGMGIKFQGLDNAVNAMGMFGTSQLGRGLESNILGQGSSGFDYGGLGAGIQSLG